MGYEGTYSYATLLDYFFDKFSSMDDDLRPTIDHFFYNGGMARWGPGSWR